MRAVARLIARFRRDRGGNAAVEFAILVPILLLLVAGTVDLGFGFQRKLELQSALNTGLQHAMQTQGKNIPTTGAVISHGLTRFDDITLEVSAFCGCASGAEGCQTTCRPGLDRYATASVLMPYKTPIFEVDMELSATFELYVGKAQ
ncbi:TadE/TadG family type IV pilus assembly protein [Devosia sp. SD17-2]|uniref:TadE/TadG family type IV pilus assembly protein n=1 Tax=Devosia sp. SD17-2 TaxID=2976459 RepID=UPI0023D89001|nr:TadE/TadG family type IV pilus assembly protein [Devosia sp. SD17-2]WEJ33817.1 pilus assembly protein [Devosia sp. SD17-2]